METLRLLWGTLLLRPYVFVFLACFLLIARRHVGWTRTLFLLVFGYAVAFASEYSSVRNGFPYGLYHYIQEPTRERELWVAGVPFMDSLSYSFLAYFSWSLALLLRCPLRGRVRTLRLQDEARRRGAAGTVLLGAALMTALDVVIDPLAHRGDEWFLGRIYYYESPGVYFDVPLSNFAGWLLVATVILGGLALCDRLLGTRDRPPATWPLWGPAVYAGVLLFNLALTFAIGQPRMGLAGIALHLPIALVALGRIARSHAAEAP